MAEVFELDTTPDTLSLWTPFKGIVPLIPKGMTIPTGARTVLEQRDCRHPIHFIVVRGEDPKLGNNKHLGEFILDSLPPAAPERFTGKTLPNRVTIEFEIDGNGILNVDAFQGDWPFKREVSIHLRIWPVEIIDWLCTEFMKTEGIDLREDTMTYQRVAEAARKAEKELSIATQVEIDLPFITADASGPKHLRMILSQAKWKQLTGKSFKPTPKKPDYESLLESPIEEQFWQAAQGKLELVPQVNIGRYRVDFAIPHRKVVIELDGHESHKSKEQRTNDAQRERFIERQGWHVIRFTGSEVYRNADQCVKEVLAYLAT